MSDLPLETIYGKKIYDLRPGMLDDEVKFSMDAIGDPSDGFDPLGPHRERILAWTRQGGGRSFRIHPLKPHLQEELDRLPDGWENDRAFHPYAIRAAAVIGDAYEIPPDLEVLILEKKEIWISKR